MTIDFGALDKEPPTVKAGRPKPETSVSVAVVSKLSLEKIKKAFAPYKAEIDSMLKEAQDLTISSDVTDAQAVAMAGEAKKLLKTLETAKLAETAPYREHTSAVNGLTKSFTDPLDRIVSILKKKIGDYGYKKILEERAAQKAQEEAAAKLQKDLNKEAAEAGVAPITVVAPAAPETKGVVRSESGSSMHTHLVWKGTITDPAKVPREFCEPNQKLIDTAVKAGVREIAGVTIEEVPDSRLRA